MKHFGDITKIDGTKVPIVDVICGGSPCQDLSVAGKRIGLSGQRSGLFMEQIRVIKEMRDESIRQIRMRGADEPVRPRYMVWENVPGAFSSNKGEDFRIVLEETARIADENAVIPGPECNRGRWQPSGCIMGDGYSVCWTLHDAQHHGVPQRRKRVCVLADFNGDTAPRILFELRRKTSDSETNQTISDLGEKSRSEVQSVSKGVSGDIEESGKEGEGTAADVRPGIEETGGAAVYGISGYDSNAMKSDNPHAGIYEAETSRTLDVNGGSPACNQGGMAVVCVEGNGSRPSHQGDGYAESETMYTLNSTEHHAVAVESHAQDARYNVGEVNQPLSANMEHDPANGGLVMVIENHPADSRLKVSEDGMVQTLSGRMGTGGGNVPMVMEQGFAMQAIGEYKQSKTASSLKMRDYKDATDLVVASFYPQMKAERQCWREDDVSNTLVNGISPGYHNGIVTAVDCRNGTENESINGTLQAKSTGGIGVNFQNVVRSGAVVRRLTPLECTRLQGFPDGWVDIGEWTDSKGKKHKDADAPKYKALGNSIALPFWEWMAKRMVQYLGEKPTMASLLTASAAFPWLSAVPGRFRSGHQRSKNFLLRSRKDGLGKIER